MKIEKLKIQVEVCREGVSLPFYAREGDAGMDVRAAEDVLIEPGQTLAIATGLKLAIPPGYEIQIRPRSGISLNTPLRVANSPGTIDSGFRDEVRVIMTNTSQISYSSQKMQTADDALALGQDRPFHDLSSKGNLQGSYRVFAGERIAQMVPVKLPQVVWQEVETVEGIGKDRKGGFGSSGTK